MFHMFLIKLVEGRDLEDVLYGGEGLVRDGKPSSECRKTLPAEALLEDTDGWVASSPFRRNSGRSNASVTSRSGSRLRSLSADGRSFDDVIVRFQVTMMTMVILYV